MPEPVIDTTSLDAIRSLYFVPGTNADGIKAGLHSGAHAVCADVEDLVPAEDKDDARRTIRDQFGSAEPGGPLLLVRINPPDNVDAYRADTQLVAELPLAGVVLPLASPQSVREVAALGRPIVAMVETAAGVRAGFEIAQDPAVARMMLGPGDLGKQMGLDVRGEPDALLFIRSSLVVDCAAAGRQAPFDTPGSGEEDEFRRTVRYGRALGFRGKLCFSPAQVAIVNEEYAGS